MVSETFCLPEDPMAVHSYELRQEIPALQLVATENGQARWGPLIRLPRGAELHDFGKGFDDQTLLVRFGSTFFIIFEQDLLAAQRSPASAGGLARAQFA